MENIKEVIEMCLEENKVEELNKFVGFSEFNYQSNSIIAFFAPIGVIRACAPFSI